MKFIMYMRIAANIGVYTSGNDVRMGKGKGSFDRWTARVAVSKIIFEIQGDLHEQVVRDAFRLAGAKLPGEFFFCAGGGGLGDDVRGCVLIGSRTVRVRQEGRPPRHGRDQARKRHHSGGPQEAAQAAAAGADGGTDSRCGESAVCAIVKQIRRREKESVCVIPCANTFVDIYETFSPQSSYTLYKVSKNPLAKSTTTLLFGKLPATPYNAAVSPLTAPFAPFPSAMRLRSCSLTSSTHSTRSATN
jgi:hypothetical protein